MLLKKSEQLIGEMREEWGKIKALQALVVEQEQRDYTQDEQDQIQKTLDRVGEIEKQITIEQKNESLNQSIDDFDQLFSKAKKSRSPIPGSDPQKAASARSLGEAFIESAEWQEFIAKAAPGGHIPERASVQSMPVKANHLLKKALRRKDVITGSSETSAGAMINEDFTGIYESIGRYPLVLRDLISVRQTTSDVVEFVRQTKQVTEADTVPEANVTDYTGASGEVSGEKPEGSTTFVRVAENVKTIAAWIPATKRALMDAMQLRGLIDDELLSDVEEELENQLLNGDGIGENFTGLANTAGVLVQAFATDIAVTARQAVTNLLINGRQIPTAYLFNPQDWESYDLLQDNEGRYYWGGPMAQGPRTLWGVPVGQSFFQTQGTGWLGNWRKMVLWDRERGNISVSDSHADFFIRNMVAILAELRAAMGVIRPSAFVEIDLSGGS